MADDEGLSPWPEDEWGRWLSPRGLAHGQMWVRPSHARERSPNIETLSTSHAAHLLQSWIGDPVDPPGGDRPPGGEVPRPVRTWIAIRLEHETTHAPLARESFAVVDSDGERRGGVLDDHGRARLESVASGACDIEFPDLDGREWGRPGAGGPGSDALEIAPARTHVVRRGDHVGAVASAAGFRSLLTVWDAPENSALRKVRNSPHVLAPRDEVFVPPRTRRIEVGATAAEHAFVARATPLSLAIRTLDPWRRPMAAADAEFLGLPPTSTDSRGQVQRSLRPSERTAHVRVGELGAQLAIGGLAPVEEGPGLRARLLNLGYLVGFAWTEVDEDELAFAIADFQADEGLDITGTVDDPTRARLVAVHGS